MELYDVRRASCVQKQKGNTVSVQLAVMAPVFLVAYQGDLRQ